MCYNGSRIGLQACLWKEQYDNDCYGAAAAAL
jgi:hypothetical protein